MFPILLALGDLLVLFLISHGCARHDRRGRGTRGRALVRAALWLYVDLPLDFDRHVRLARAHQTVSVYHTLFYVGLNVRFDDVSPVGLYTARVRTAG